MEDKSEAIERSVVESRSLIEQIEKLLSDAKQLIKSNLDFHAFIIISIGIEVLGSLYDAHDINDSGESDSRFKNCLKKNFKDPRYRNNQEMIYKNLRCSLIHQYRAGDEVKLTSVCLGNAKMKDHFIKQGDKTIFVAEKLMEDFEDALKRSKNKIKKDGATKNKAEKKHEEVYFEGNIRLSGLTSPDIIKIEKKKKN